MTKSAARLALLCALVGLGASVAAAYVHYHLLFDPNYTKDWEAKRPQYFQMDDDAQEAPDTIVLSKNSNYTTVTQPKNNAKPKSSLQGPMGDMTAGLVYVLSFVNRTISTIDSSLL